MWWIIIDAWCTARVMDVAHLALYIDTCMHMMHSFEPYCDAWCTSGNKLKPAQHWAHIDAWCTALSDNYMFQSMAFLSAVGHRHIVPSCHPNNFAFKQSPVNKLCLSVCLFVCLGRREIGKLNDGTVYRSHRSRELVMFNGCWTTLVPKMDYSTKTDTGRI